MADTIKEFLVALGFKVDETAMKKFSVGVTNITKGVITLGKEVEIAALAVAIGVAKFASNLEQLYFAAKRTGNSADELKAFTLAAQNFGASADEAMGSVEALAAFLRNNPAGESLIKGWLGQAGIDTKNLRTSMDMMKALGQMFAKQNAGGMTWLSNLQAGQLGISDKTMLAMADPGFTKQLEADERRTRGWAAMSKAAHAFMEQLRGLERQLQQLLFGLQGPIMSALERIMKSISNLSAHHGKEIIHDIADAFVYLFDKLGELLNWIDTHGKEIQQGIDQTFKQLKDVKEAIRPALEWLYNEFMDLNRATDGWLAKLLLTTAALKLLGASSIVSGIAALGAGLLKAFGGSLAAAATASEGTGLWAAAGWAWGVSAALAIGIGLGALLDKFFPNNPAAKVGEWLGGFLQEQMMKLDPKLIGYTDANKPQPWAQTHFPWEGGQGNSNPQPNVTVNHSTTVNVNGSGDPHTVASDVVKQQSQIARDSAAIVREFALGSQ